MKATTQVSKLLPSLFEHIDEGQPLTVFHVGPALPDTVEFFASYRCKLFFVDLFSHLPVVLDEEQTPSLEQQFANILALPEHTRFDICLFWDLFNFLSGEAISAFLSVLSPHLKEHCLAHAFSVHNLKSRADGPLYGISQSDILSCRRRRAEPPGYAPHSQRQLKALLHCFNLERSVLLPDSRLELLLQARL